jgi:ribonucleoside-diphosphate reductase alpha chain
MPKSILENGDLTDPFQSFISKDKYSRFREDLGRRETWEETVDRYCAFMQVRMDERYPGVYGKRFWNKARKAILNLEVMPSMRGLMTAGPALEKSEMSLYNCSFLAFNDVRAFDELLFILANGTGVGFSVEKEYTEQLPDIPTTLERVQDVIVVADSREGWAAAYRSYLEALYLGFIPSLDITKVRPEGARLKTFGGTASGPQPFVDLIDFTIRKFQAAKGRKLTPIEVHDIACMIGDSIVSGGVRRSALISLSDLNDYDMSKAKSGQWRDAPDKVQRELANNSAVYNSKPSTGQFLQEWGSIFESYSGERGIFNKESARRGATAPRRDSSKIAGTNPCGEIFLRDGGLCNLTEVVVRENDTLDDLLDKVEIATALGTIQSSFTDFMYVRDIWKENAEEERLLGVSFTGIFSNPMMNGQEGKRILQKSLTELRLHAISTNKALAEQMGINQSAAITCVKPSGTASLLTYASSGLHPWHAQTYLRTIRANNHQPMTQFLKDQGVPWEPNVTKPDSGTVFTFPMKAPDGAVVKADLTAVEHLDLWLTYKKYWTEHNPSVTVEYKEDEWFEIGAWVLEHWDDVGGLTFLPDAGNVVYPQMPLQEIDEAQYNQWMNDFGFPETIDWSEFSRYETEDTTTSSQQLACVSGVCDLVEIG